jgi:hypothetical protein
MFDMEMRELTAMCFIEDGGEGVTVVSPLSMSVFDAVLS